MRTDPPAGAMRDIGVAPPCGRHVDVRDAADAPAGVLESGRRKPIAPEPPHAVI